MSYSPVRLGELFEIKHGWAFKGEFFKSEGEVIVVTPGNFYEAGGFRQQAGKEKFYSGKFPPEFLLEKNDLVIAMTEQGEGLLGSPALIPTDNRYLHNQRIGLFTNIDSERADKIFLYYLFFTREVRDEIAGSATGTKVKHTAPKRIYSIKVGLPPLPTQRKIASILSAYDDLIENNLKRIKLLEELAQRTYEEWFVKFRINRKQLKVNKATGLPEGWEKVSCYDAMEVLSGGTPKTDIVEYWDGTIQFFTPKDASEFSYTNGTEKTITELGLMKCNSKLYPIDTVFITARGTVGKINLAAEPMAMNQSCYALKGKDFISQLFLYNSIVSAVRQIKGAANGGVFDAIVVDTFKHLKFIKPPINLVELYTMNVSPVYNLIKNLLNQNRLLKEARDILLPRLMSGAIDVEEANEEVLSMAAEPLGMYRS